VTKSSEAEVILRSRRMWESIWPAQRLRQRAFLNYGMEVILQLNLTQIRHFFAAFFSLSDFHWRGFLSSRLSFGELIGFGLSLFQHACNDVRISLLSTGLPRLPGLFAEIARSQTKLLPNTLGKADR
jgi:lycopene beta-cyclase